MEFPTKLKTRNRISSKPPQIKDFTMLMFNTIFRENGTKFILKTRKTIFNAAIDLADYIPTIIFKLLDKCPDNIPYEYTQKMKLFSDLLRANIPRHLDIPVKSFTDFTKFATGYFDYINIPYRQHDRLIHFKDFSESSSLVRGCFIISYAKSILKCNDIKCIVMDTTFRIFPLYTTAFLFAVYSNTGIPLAYSFARTESTKIYSIFFDAFKIFLGVDLSIYKLLSDQGSALKAVANEKGCRHFFCLRHALKSLGTDLFSFEVGELIKAKTLEDFTSLKTEFENRFQTLIPHSENYKRLNQKLKKVGLVYSENQIIINDHNKFQSFSMAFRALENVPTTTNCLESYHGHQN
jgi:hypothetical protein